VVNQTTESRVWEYRGLGNAYTHLLGGDVLMPAIEVGRICVKLYGREAGRKCVIVDIVDDNYVLITGPKSVSGVKRRRVNVNHVEPLDRKVEIPRGASDEEVVKALELSGLLDFMKERVRVGREEFLFVRSFKRGLS